MCDNVLQESFEELNGRKGALLFVGSFTCPSPKNLALTGWSCVEVAAQIGKYFFSSASFLGFGCFLGNRLKNRPPIKSAESSAAGGSRYIYIYIIPHHLHEFISSHRILSVPAIESRSLLSSGGCKGQTLDDLTLASHGQRAPIKGTSRRLFI